MEATDNYGPRPQVIVRTVPSWYNRATDERMPEHQYEDVTGWWEMREGPLHAFAQTAEGARQMIEQMKAAH